MTLPPALPSRLDQLRDLRDFIDREIAVELGQTTTGIIEHIADLYGVSPSAILGRSRIRSITRARHAVAWTMRRQGKSFRDIGDALGLDHSSALHAYNKVEKSPGVRALLISQLDDPTARTGA
jgi:chromosomal replication initiation ATPase DnaA